MYGAENVTSYDQMAPPSFTSLSYFSVDLLCGTTATELLKSVDLLCYPTAAELHNSVILLCGTKAAELNPV